MILLIELEGVILDVKDAYYHAHGIAATEVGWSKLDSSLFWRLYRKDPTGAKLLPGAKPNKIESYQKVFQTILESPEIISRMKVHDEMVDTLASLSAQGQLVAVTLGNDVNSRQQVLNEARVDNLFTQVIPLNNDPRRRPGELKMLAGGDPRTLVVATSGALLRASGSAEYLAIGVSCGPTMAPLLHQAGADLVYAALSQLVDSLGTGAADLIRAGFLPADLGA